MAAVGEVLGGKVRLVRLIGEGGMASVFEGADTRLGRRVAVKVLASIFTHDPELVARFEREARAVARLDTHHVPRVLDVGQTEDGCPFIELEYLDGHDVETELQARGALPHAEVVEILLQAAAGVHVAHEAGIVHRDLKPANLFLSDGETGRVVRILDFGISKVLGEPTKLTAPTAVMGTVLYMSPEQVRAAANVDARSDIWSLGVIAYELLAGRPPFEGNAAEIAGGIVREDPVPIETRAEVPPALAQIVGTMLQRDPARRPQSARDLLFTLVPLAPRGSLGALAAEAVLGSALVKAANAPVTQRTVRIQRSAPPAAREGHSGFPSTPSAQAFPVPHVSLPPMPPAATPPPSAPSRSAWVAGGLLVLFAVLGACGIVLAAVASHRARPMPGKTVEPPAAARPASSR